MLLTPSLVKIMSLPAMPVRPFFAVLDVGLSPNQKLLYPGDTPGYVRMLMKD
jgi:hypothetical protein